jgi:hypothetical protein
MKNLFKILFLIVLSNQAFTQDKVQDSTKTEILDEVLVKAVRVNADSPITHSNINKEDLEKRNLGQDLPILLTFYHRLLLRVMLVLAWVTQVFECVVLVRSLLILQ